MLPVDVGIQACIEACKQNGSRGLVSLTALSTNYSNDRLQGSIQILYRLIFFPKHNYIVVMTKFLEEKNNNIQ